MQTYGGGGISSAPRLQTSIKAEFIMADGAPNELELIADAACYGKPRLTKDGKPHRLVAEDLTREGVEATDDSVMGIVMTRCGGAVLHKTRMLRMLVDGSHPAEQMATTRGGEFVEIARDIETAIGVPPVGATFVGTDNMSNALVAGGTGSSQRSRHFLRRYYTFLQRVGAGDIVVGHVADKENPADFLTKWLTGAKLEASIDYLTNRASRVVTKAGARTPAA